MAINNKELKKLAVLVNKTVHSVEFPEELQFDAHVDSTLSLLDSMEAKHENNEMLTSMRSAIVNIPQSKLQFFKAAHDLFAKINVTEPRREIPAGFDFMMMPPVAAGVSMQISM